MAENRNELLAHYRRMRGELIAAIEGLSDEQLTERSLDGWSVKDHLAHLALWDEIRAAEVERISAGHASAWPPSGWELYAALNELRRDFSLAQAHWELARTHERLIAAIERAPEQGLDGSRYGEAGLVSQHEAQHTAWIRRWRESNRA
jgi:uncharacterized damage-inducible protein DinB